ncbi:MAG: hypothetical protein PHV34_24560 [Verrucomicrobiae bacterium]|nr:hypothetical protein [Verrucomicrobiae bacterium]
MARIIEAGPIEGFWYFVRFPDRWKLIPVRYDEVTDKDQSMTHPDFWERSLVVELGRAYGLDDHSIDELRLFGTYAFPRGRISKAGNNWFSSWGNNIPAGVPFNKAVVERYFGLTPDHKVRWMVDDHEVVAAADKEIAHKLLGIKEDWPGESVMGQSCGVSILRRH